MKASFKHISKKYKSIGLKGIDPASVQKDGQASMPLPSGLSGAGGILPTSPEHIKAYKEYMILKYEQEHRELLEAQKRFALCYPPSEYPVLETNQAQRHLLTRLFVSLSFTDFRKLSISQSGRVPLRPGGSGSQIRPHRPVPPRPNEPPSPGYLVTKVPKLGTERINKYLSPF